MGFIWSWKNQGGFKNLMEHPGLNFYLVRFCQTNHPCDSGTFLYKVIMMSPDQQHRCLPPCNDWQVLQTQFQGACSSSTCARWSLWASTPWAYLESQWSNRNTKFFIIFYILHFFYLACVAYSVDVKTDQWTLEFQLYITWGPKAHKILNQGWKYCP